MVSAGQQERVSMDEENMASLAGRRSEHSTFHGGTDYRTGNAAVLFCTDGVECGTPKSKDDGA